MTLLELQTHDPRLHMLGSDELEQFNELDRSGKLGLIGSSLQEARLNIASLLIEQTDDMAELKQARTQHADAFMDEEWETIQRQGPNNSSITYEIAFEVDSVAMVMLGKLGREHVYVPDNRTISDQVYRFMRLQIPPPLMGYEQYGVPAAATKAALIGSIALLR